MSEGERVAGRKGGRYIYIYIERERERKRESTSQIHTIRNVRKMKWSWTMHMNRLKAR